MVIFWFANWALLSLLISSSVFPENIDPHITSMHPDFLVFSENIFVTLIVGFCKYSHKIAVMEDKKQEFLSEVNTTLEALESKVYALERTASSRVSFPSFGSLSKSIEPIDLSLDDVELGTAIEPEPVDREPVAIASAKEETAKAETEEDMPLEAFASPSPAVEKPTKSEKAEPAKKKPEEEGLLLDDSPKPEVPKTEPKPHHKKAADLMSQQYAWRVDAAGSPVANIISAIALNDRVLFINTLFGQDPALFQSALSKFNSMNSLEEALEYIQETYPKWNMSSQIMYKFMMAVRRKLQ